MNELRSILFPNMRVLHLSGFMSSPTFAASSCVLCVNALIPSCMFSCRLRCPTPPACLHLSTLGQSSCSSSFYNLQSTVYRPVCMQQFYLFQQLLCSCGCPFSQAGICVCVCIYIYR